MRLGILSDTHNNAANTQAALSVFRQHGITQLVHCGDVNRADILDLFTGFEMWLVWGNNDFELSALRVRAKQLANAATCQVHCMGYDALLEFDGHQVGACHGDDEERLAGLARSGLCEWVFRGHSHLHGIEKSWHSSTKILNPGALGGRHPEPRHIAILDLAKGQPTFVAV
jgi:putative phosphoesterase